ncbi:MAG: Bax inhibitor-1/YccA family protein [Flavobacteriales bacterium]
MNTPYYYETEAVVDAQKQAAFMSKVYGWMFLALIVTGLVAHFTASSALAMQLIYGNKLAFWVLILAQLGLVVGIGRLLHKISYPVAIGLFMLYAGITGLTFGGLFMVYSQQTIGITFLCTAGLFGSMAAIGYFTKRDLTSLGSLLIVGLIGVVIASLVNLFLHSDTLTWIITYVGLAVFLGLTAYDNQKLKHMALALDEESARKGSIFGALTLYLDFVNIFLFLLRILGGRK